MDFAFYYKGRDGTMWYRCNNCGHITRGKPHLCPVCQGIPIKRGEDNEP